jgi:hypothetical protein
MPYLAATPVPAMMDVGVASPSAHGQAMTCTATALSSACCQSPVRTHQQALGIDRAAGDAVAGVFRHRQAFAGDQRLVEMAAALDDDAVDRHPRARPQHHGVANPYLADRDHGVRAAAPDDGVGRAQGFQRMQRGDGLAFGPGLQPFSQQDQGDDDGRRLEVEVAHASVAGPAGRREQQVDRQGIGGAGAERNQQVHVAGAGEQRLPAGLVETRTQPELHRRRQRHLQPAGHGQVESERHGQHRREQRQAQQRGDRDRPPFRQRGRRLAAAVGTADRCGVIAGLLHGGDQRFERHADCRHVGFFGGEVD